MYSMTGFGNSNGSVGGFDFEVVIKSVNGRYLEVRPHIPRKYIALESDIVKLVKQAFIRGTVDVHIHFAQMPIKGNVVFHVDIAKDWLKKANSAFKELKVEAKLTAHDILSIPDFVQVKETQSISEKEKKQVFECVKDAIDKCNKERAREGARLQSACLGYAADFVKMHVSIAQERTKYSSDIFSRAQEKYQKFLKDHGGEVNEERLLQEVAHLVEKSDVEEELIRFLEHVRNVEKLLKAKSNEGKKLDFYAQELLREVNTIGSKSQYATITERVVALKSKIEQFREQVQNIE